MESPNKILLTKLRALGDTALLTASIRALREHLPRAELHVLVPEAWTELLRGQPGISKLWLLRRPALRVQRSTELGLLALKLRAEHFDWVINPHASPSSALLMWATRAPWRAIQFHGHKDRDRFSTVTIPGKGSLKPSLERDFDALRALGVQIPPGLLPQLALEPSTRQEAAAYLPHDRTRLLILGLGASRPTKRWPSERFAEVALRWIQEAGGTVRILTGPAREERALGESVLSQISNPGAELLPPIALRLLGPLLSHADLFLTGDSGPKHVAVAVGTPTVTIFGPEDPYEWHPYSRASHPFAYVQGLSCRRDAAPGMPPWCGLSECVTEKHRCMTGISVDEVFELCRNAARNGRPQRIS